MKSHETHLNGKGNENSSNWTGIGKFAHVPKVCVAALIPPRL